MMIFIFIMVRVCGSEGYALVSLIRPLGTSLEVCMPMMMMMVVLEMMMMMLMVVMVMMMMLMMIIVMVVIRLQRCIATINRWTDYCNNREIIVSDYWLSQKHRQIIGPDGFGGQHHHRCDYFSKPSGPIILRCF